MKDNLSKENNSEHMPRFGRAPCDLCDEAFKVNKTRTVNGYTPERENEMLEDIKNGELIGPFKTVEELMKNLES